MEQRGGRRQRFIVMPRKGISSPAMQASVFKERSSSALIDSVAAQFNRSTGLNASPGLAGAIALAPSTSQQVTKDLGAADFEVLSQRFEDGPATVAMSPAARLALQASNPDLRILPITRYYLPGERPRKATAASLPSAESAVAPDGSIYSTDLKQHLLAGVPDGARGEGVIVGVLDTGVDNTHPALAGRVSALRCFVPGAPSTAGGPVDWGVRDADIAAHGTHVAGIIAAAEGFGGPAGVAPNARVLSYRVFPDNPAGKKPAENAVIIDSIRAAIDDGCHIINLSLEGGTLREDGVRTAIADAWENGVVCVAAAGNGFGNPVSFPAALPHCVAVTAIGRDGHYPVTQAFRDLVSDQRASTDPAVFIARFSNFGPPVKFAAPGHAIVSTFPAAQWCFYSGTSMAAPFVSGVLARLLSDNVNILNMMGSAQRSSAMLQMLIARARVLGLPQSSQEGYGLPG